MPQSVVSVPHTQQSVVNVPQQSVTVSQPSVSKRVVSSVESAPVKSVNVQSVQWAQPAVTQYSTKNTVSHKLPNPLVFKLSPISKTVNSPQTFLTNAQLVSDVADGASNADVAISQETESY